MLASITNVACAGAGPDGARTRVDATRSISTDLDRLAGGLTTAHAATFRSILETTLAEDPYVCRPAVREVFFGAVPEGERLIVGVMPHYGFFFGPMRYGVRRRAASWEVTVTIAVDLPAEGGMIELPDCALAEELAGPGHDVATIGATCRGTPYAASGSLEACPGSGVFTVPATRRAMRALLARWSREAPGYWDRDAAAFGIPVRYRFAFVDAEEISPHRADLRVPLSTTCGRTPYFASFRSGWSLPIVAHEVGHVLGLLDEYETFSGITPLYPKTPFPGAEVSRMGLSMREDTKVLPLHHYLVLRRWFCPEPEGGFYDVAP
ncbi:Hypothetical protein A7982_01537 [Minicystis rosea]|nr:Hypothetical protein A7982_01537 [Minicystis rosea]